MTLGGIGSSLPQSQEMHNMFEIIIETKQWYFFHFKPPLICKKKGYIIIDAARLSVWWIVVRPVAFRLYVSAGLALTSVFKIQCIINLSSNRLIVKIKILQFGPLHKKKKGHLLITEDDPLTILASSGAGFLRWHYFLLTFKDAETKD